MRKCILLISFLCFVFCAIADNNKDCGKGNQNPGGGGSKSITPGPGTTTSGGASVDPNEIIGPTGYDDSIRWVSINDILNYTILFENDPEFATANAQKVDVRFTFDDKAYIKGFGLSAFGFVRTSVINQI